VTSRLASIRIGSAGWSIPQQRAAPVPVHGSHLERYGAVLNASEINSSFHRRHQPATYERWAASVPHDFRFAVKIPKAITHERRLKDTGDLLDGFLSDVAGLGTKLGPLLIQLPPSLIFDDGTCASFFRDLRERVDGSIVCEPRHESWFTPEVEGLLDELRIARVAADPARVSGAGEPGGWRGLSYYRLHGSPRIYYSAYEPDTLAGIAGRLVKDATAGSETWCILDNTAGSGAFGDALMLRDFVKARTCKERW
jgi:uncharacterized protein YecE (DUF72 family)